MPDRKPASTGFDIGNWRAEARAQRTDQRRWEPGPLPVAPQPRRGEIPVAGYLALDAKGHGTLRAHAVPGADDPFVTAALARRLGLRLGDYVDGIAAEDDYGLTVQEVWRINGHGVQNVARRPDFRQLTAVHPDRLITLGYRPEAIAGRLLDLVAPIGRGQRGLIVAPPQAGKTTVLEHIAHAVATDRSWSCWRCW